METSVARAGPWPTRDSSVVGGVYGVTTPCSMRLNQSCSSGDHTSLPLALSSFPPSSSFFFRLPPRPPAPPPPRPLPRPLPRNPPAPASPPPRWKGVLGPPVRGGKPCPPLGANRPAGRGVVKRPLRLRRLIMVCPPAGPPRPGEDAPKERASTRGALGEPDCPKEPRSEAAAANRCRVVGRGWDGWSSCTHCVVDRDRWLSHRISTRPRPRAERTAARFMAIEAVFENRSADNLAIVIWNES